MQRSERAKAAYVGTTRQSYLLAIEVEKLVSSQLKGRMTPLHHPFDVIVDDAEAAVEIKTILLTGKENPKVTQRQGARQRKRDYLAGKNLCAFTLAVDMRGALPRFYLREGIGCYQLENMQPCTSLKHVRRQLVGSYRQRLAYRTTG